MSSLPPPFSVTIHSLVENEVQVVRVAVAGEFVVGNADLFDAATGHLATADVPMTVVALDDVTLLDSAGIGAILRLRKRCSAAGVGFGVYAPVPFQRDLFTITGLEHVLVEQQV